jgi:hypothetical protein
MPATPTPKKTLILHIGMGKTGTTAVQKAMWRNRAVLARAGIAYPDIGATAGAHHLISPHVLPHLSHRAPWRRFRAPAEWAPKVAALRQPRVFMSSELISSAEPAAVAAFCAALEPWFDLHVCIYLRRQDDMIAAVYAQGVRGGIQRRPIATVFDGRLPHYDYMARLAPWEAALGRNRIIVRPYERRQFPQGDLIRDIFLHALGLDDLPPGFVHDPDANLNARLSIPAMEFRRLVNVLIPDRARSRPFIAPLLTCPPDPKGSHLLGRADRERLIAHFADSNARVAQTWLGRPAGDLFREPLPPDAPDTAPVPGPADLRAVAVHLGQEAPGLLYDLRDLIAADHRADPPARAAAATLAAAFDGLTLPPEPLRHRLGRQLGHQLGRFLGRSHIKAGTRPPEPVRPPAPASEKPSPAPIHAPRLASSPAPRLLIHFGTHKTGSSAIQLTLWNNRHRLGNARLLDFGNMNGGYAMVNFFRSGMRDPAELATALQQLDGKTGIISGEAISGFTSDEIDRMLAVIAGTGTEVRFIGYVREPAGFYTSFLQQKLKTQAVPFDDPGQWLADLNRPYFRWIDLLADKAGADRVTAFPFERATFPQGDVVRHFLGQAGLDADHITPVRINESLSTLAVKALYVWRNRAAPDDRAVTYPMSRGQFIQRLQTIPGPRFQIGPAIEDKLRARHPDYPDWARDRLIWPKDHQPLPPPPRGTAAPGTPVITAETDLLLFSQDELDTLARWAGLPPTGAVAEEGRPDHVVRIMAAAREQTPPVPLNAPAIQRRATPPAQRMLVHFGTRKTGTSSIQETLFRNEGRLGQARYLAFGRANSSLMVRDLFVAPNPATQDRLHARFAAALRAIAAAPQAIFSAETICDLNPDGLARLAAALTAQGARLTWLGYLRDPVSFSRSIMQERLKLRYFDALPFLPDAPLTKSFHRIVEHLDTVAGRDNVQVFPFDRALFPKGDVVRHFLDQAGIEPDSLTFHRVNDGLSATAVKALHAYRRLRIPQDKMIGSDATRDDFIATLATLGGPAFQLSPDIEARIAAANTHILDWSEARLGHRLTPPPRSDDDGIRTEADMLTFTPEDLARLDALAEARQVPGLPAGLSPAGSAEAVADLLHALRLQAAQAKPVAQA